MKTIDLTGKTAVVSGGGGEIGFAMCEGLAEAGANVIALDINTERVPQDHEKISALPLDLSDTAGIRSAVKDISEIDILVHAAGVNIAAPVAEFEEQAWDAVFDVNLKSAFFLTKALLPRFQSGRNGKIVFVSSISAKLGYPGLHAYTASKGGLDALIRNLSTELAADGICVNGIAPGTTKTGMTKGLWDDKEKCRAHEATIPMGRMADCSDHIGPLLFLCSEMSDYVTGQILCSDGGLTSVQADFINLELRGGNE